MPILSLRELEFQLAKWFACGSVEYVLRPHRRSGEAPTELLDGPGDVLWSEETR